MSDDRYLLAEISDQLNAWGKWTESKLYYEGYPTRSSGMQLVNYSGGQYGHRMLCLDMPARLYAINQAILRLTEEERGIVRIWYVYRVRTDGTLWSIEDRALVAGMSDNALRQKVYRIRQRLAQIRSNLVIQTPKHGQDLQSVTPNGI